MDAIKTLIDQILNVIKSIGSDNGQLTKIVDALKNMFAGILTKKEDTAE